MLYATTVDYVLNKLGAAVNNRFRFINSGGCCVYAALVAAELTKLNIQTKGIVGSRNATDETSIDIARSYVERNTIAEWQDNMIDLYHVGIEFVAFGETKHYDSNGVKLADGYIDSAPLYDGRLELSELEELAADNNWNPAFKRGNIPALRSLVKLYLKDLNIPIKESDISLAHSQYC